MEQSSRWRILAVDDHEDTLNVIRTMLSEKYDVLTLVDPTEIYEIINIFEPDLLILDIMMPKITGFQILDLLQKNKAYKNLPVIILSAKDTTREIKYGYKLGASLYLTKPFEPERLLRNVELLFQHTPPGHKDKKFNIKQVMVQLNLRKSYTTGSITFTSAVLNSEDMQSEDFRKAVEEAKKRTPLHGDDRWRG